MMIEVRNTPITLLAMLGPLLNMRFAYIAVVFINIYVKFHHIISSYLGFPLKVDRNICGIDYCCLECINSQENHKDSINASQDSS
jgi:hypothetical protein